MTALYEMTGQYRELMEMAEELDEQVFQDTLEMIQEGINEKAENIAMLMRNINGDVEALKAEEKRLQERRRSLEKKHDNMKSYLQEQMIAADMDKVPSTLFKIAIRNNPPKVSVLDENVIPDNYFITKRQLDKTTLKDALKNGEEIEGAQLIQEKGLTIK